MPPPRPFRRHLSGSSSFHHHSFINDRCLHLVQNAVVATILSAMFVAAFCWNSIRLLSPSPESLLGAADAYEPAAAWNEMDETTVPILQQTQQLDETDRDANDDNHILSSSSTPFTIIILTMNRLASLKRLLHSLEVSHYGTDDKLNLVLRIDQLPPQQGVPGNNSTELLADWNQLVSFCQGYTFPHGGTTQVHIAPQHLGLRQSWLEAWQPTHSEERAMILEDDTQVSPLWYQWVQTMYHHYGGTTTTRSSSLSSSSKQKKDQQYHSIAGFSLQRQQLIPVKERIMGKMERALSAAAAAANGRQEITTNQTTPRVSPGDPFLYRLVGPIGFVPMAGVWRDFLEWMKCAQCPHGQPNNKTLVNVTLPGLVTSDWYHRLNQRDLWTPHMIYYMQQRRLFCLYQFPLESQALAVHHNEPGAHLQRARALGADAKLTTRIRDLKNASSWNELAQSLPPFLLQFDLAMRQISSDNAQTLVTAWAAGSNALSDYERFVTSLRQHYDGDVKLMIDAEASVDIRQFLTQERIDVVENNNNTQLSKDEGGQPLNFRVALDFYSDACQGYDWCLMVRFAGSYFQSHPFRWSPLLRPKRSISKPTTMLSTNKFNDTNATTGVPQHATKNANHHSNRTSVDYDLLMFQIDDFRWGQDQLLPHDDEYCISAVRDDLANKTILQASGFFATPAGLSALKHSLSLPRLRHCHSEVVVVNAAVHADLLSENRNTSNVMHVNVSNAVDRNDVVENHVPRIKIYNETHVGRIIHEHDGIAGPRAFTRDNLGRMGGSDCRVSPIVLSRTPTHDRKQPIGAQLQHVPLNKECLG